MFQIELAALSGQKPSDEVRAGHIDDLKRALERDPQNISTRFALAQALLAARQLPQAEAELKRILEISRSYVPANIVIATSVA